MVIWYRCPNCGSEYTAKQAPVVKHILTDKGVKTKVWCGCHGKKTEIFDMAEEGVPDKPTRKRIEELRSRESWLMEDLEEVRQELVSLGEII